MENRNIEEQINTIFRVCLDAKKNGKRIDEAFIDYIIEHFKPLYTEFSDENWTNVKFKIETNINVEIEEKAILLTNPDVERWLDHKRSEISWSYWEAYVELLKDKGRSTEEIEESEKTIDEILDCSGDPKVKGSWDRRGLVMGNVQSGKTQNYLGLINKAIDCGYKIIVVLGGHLNELRKQTQERLDEGVIGRESKIKYGSEPIIGVGKTRTGNSRPYYLTTTDNDFKKNIANSMGIHFQGSNETIVLVIKKWASIIENLCEWIEEKNDLNIGAGLKLDNQLLLIDDEADYASINTKHDKNDITAINNNIRRLLSYFNRSTYIGYTATPFANIFINPDETDDALGDDLFPKDFMIRTPTPDSYVGYKHYFQANDDSRDNPVIKVNDFEAFLPPKSKKDAHIGDIPESLKEAVQAFLISVATRAHRGRAREHATMLINMTHLTILQEKISDVVAEYVKQLRNASNLAFGYPLDRALNDSSVARDFRKTFTKLYSIEEKFEQVYPHLKWAIAKTKVFPVHSKSSNKLDYDAYKDNGLSAIVIGGHKLSRGLTLEGLTISYFTRSSKTYDTLMQMCRWFGYRPGYKDLCRLYITPESYDWYTFISDAIDELYLELDHMAKLKKTPSDFGLKVREHPGALQITAKQKINAAHSHTRSVDLAGRRIRRHDFYISDETNSGNINATRKLVEKMISKGCESRTTKDGSIIFLEVDHSLLVEYISETRFVDNVISDGFLIQTISKFEENKLPKFSVCIKNIGKEAETWWSKQGLSAKNRGLPSTFSINSTLQITPSKRKLSMSIDRKTMFWGKQEIGSKNDERYFLKEPDCPENKKYSNSFQYIRHPERDQPGLIIYTFAVGLLEPKDAKEGDQFTLKIPHTEPTISYSISFPVHEHLKHLSKKEYERIRQATKVAYMANKILKETDIDYEMDENDED